MKKMLKVLGIILIVILVLVILLVIKIVKDQKIQAEDQMAMVKSDEELIGEHLYISRDNKEDIDVNVYIRSGDEKLPLVINIHGGAFIAGDADTLDTQSDRISKTWNVNVVTVNYKLLNDNYDKQYAIDEIKDTVKYFIANSDKYNIDIDNIFILGYSAGGYYAMASTLQLHKENVNIKGQILCYAFLSDILEQYNTLTDLQKRTIPSALFILAGDEPIGKSSLDYEKVLNENGVNTAIKIYENVLHGFIEENNSEYEKLHDKNKTSKSPEAEKVAREAEDYIMNWISKTK
ncbi:MAG: alpha/beta hydrolase fold domain-containing protein [Clostridia bacterium]|nr:alpha/beta hydrolase fold domain-containing protein [Clostridia bacterium]